MNDGDERRDSLGRVGGGGDSMSKIFYSVAFEGNEAVSGFPEKVATGRIYIEVTLGSSPPYSFIGSSDSVCKY